MIRRDDEHGIYVGGIQIVIECEERGTGRTDALNNNKCLHPARTQARAWSPLLDRARSPSSFKLQASS